MDYFTWGIPELIIQSLIILYFCIGKAKIVYDRIQSINIFYAKPYIINSNPLKNLFFLLIWPMPLGFELYKRISYNDHGVRYLFDFVIFSIACYILSYILLFYFASGIVSFFFIIVAMFAVCPVWVSLFFNKKFIYSQN